MSQQARESFDAGFSLMEKVFNEKYEDVTPEFTRKVSIMECLLFAFVEHAEDLSLIDRMENELKDLVVNHRATMN